MFRTPYAVRFADVDNAGIFYYPRFFHAFHVAFEEFWERSAERPYHIVLGEARIGFPPVHIETDFNRPVTFGDPMEIRIGVKRFGRTSLDFRYEVVHRETDHVHVAADITKACVDMKTFTAVPCPQHLLEMLEAIRIDD